MDLYTGKINEFVDWVSGINYFTQLNETDDKPVSGGSIRELLQERLRLPFYMKEDVENNLYRMFSSETSYNLWAENPSDNSDLLLFSFVRPSDYKLTFYIDSSNKYVRAGDTNNEGVRINYMWNISNDEGESTDSLTVTYTISNGNTGKSETFTRYYNKGEAPPNFNIYKYLDLGTNTITIEGRGTTTGARNSVVYNVVLLDLKMSSSFNFVNKREGVGLMTIPFTFERNNIEGSAKIHFYLDGNSVAEHDVLPNTQSIITSSKNIQTDLEPGLHNLLIWATASYNDNAVLIDSNLLYFTFAIASDSISVSKYICISTSFDTGSFPFSSLALNATQYLSTSLDWGYYTDSLQLDTAINVTWKLHSGIDGDDPILLGTTLANTQLKASTLQYVPSIYTTYDEESNPLTYIAAYHENTELIRIPIYIIKNDTLKIYETGSYSLKLSAYGKINDASDKETWYDQNGVNRATFTNIKWNPNSGWYLNGLRTVGEDEYITIDCDTFNNFSFENGKTIEIEFESEKVNSGTDKLIVIGHPTQARIEITPNTATLYDRSGASIVHTNYKANERLKLAFILNKYSEQDSSLNTVESGLAYIVNNGILERAANASGSNFVSTGGIKIGGSRSGVKVYSIKIYNYSITYTDEYNNYVYDSEDKIQISLNNDILNASDEIDYDLCKNKLDTILISGDLSDILRAASDKDQSTTNVTIERTCPYDVTKNFKIGPVQIRKHGQSTLNYPITSMKIWLNKAYNSNVVPTFEITPVEKLSLNKNRYRMKNTSIPSNKFVLQANYADSSGVHNGGLERLIQLTWFNAQIDGEHKLRTAPQLFASGETVTHNDLELHETGWIEGVNESNKTWADYFNTDFPYQIEVAPDSFPCAVFYYDEQGTQQRTFLGQYVFMEDKKSDFLFGERSIYKIQYDPFCLTTAHSKDDTNANKVWDNSNVLRIEVIGAYNKMVGYNPLGLDENNQPMEIDDIVEVPQYDENDNEISRIRTYRWESQFEMIYPDPEDVAGNELKGTGKFQENSKFRRTAQPFVDWYKWLVSTYQNQLKFLNEAAQHLELYKMAAYYIFFLRFGLVDSVERNAQIKTYDGVHFHYEPWDMDIANGNKNDGGIAFDPPIDRNTTLDPTGPYAFSGRSGNAQGLIETSNWLWDALEAWPYWINTIVPKVADALYNAGLTYDNITEMFDEEYSDAWCETMYNKSGYFKYVESGAGDPKWLNWLQGARKTHRHWWLSTSMDYYDAKWFCGDYKNHAIYLSADVAAGNNGDIVITPNKSTYMAVRVGSTGTPVAVAVSQANALHHNMDGGSTTKDPIHIFGANFMEEIDMSNIAKGITNLNLDAVYSNVLGSPLKRLNVGTVITASGSDYTTTLSVSDIKIGITDNDGIINAFENLRYLNFRGLTKITDIISWTWERNLTELTEVRAMGSGLRSFYSSQSGNKFDMLELPSTIATLQLQNSTWTNLEFWDCTEGLNNNATLSLHQSDAGNNIPANITSVSFLGTTCQTRNSLEFVRHWLQSIMAENNNDSTVLNDYTFRADKINWTPETVGGDNNLLTYDELALLAQLNGPEGNKNYQLRGYIVLRNEDNTSLTAAQLTQIKAWFGDTVFNRNSSGLVIDHRLNYVLINLGGDIYIQNGEPYVVEGGRVSLNATRFALAESSQDEYLWEISEPGGSGVQQLKGGAISVILAEYSNDGIAYVVTKPSTTNGDYLITISVTVEGLTYTTALNVVGATYPSDLYIDYDEKSITKPKTAASYITYWLTGISMDYFINSLLNYTIGINKVQYNLYNVNDPSEVYSVIVLNNSKTESGALAPSDDKLTPAIGTKGILISHMSETPSDNTIHEYVLEAVVTYDSQPRSTVTVSKRLLVMLDSSWIVTSTSNLNTPLTTSWYNIYGLAFTKNGFYRTDLYALNGAVDFSTNNSITNLATNNQDTILKYLPNVTSINLSGLTISDTYTTNGVTISLIDFSNIPNLQHLDIHGCSNLSNAINLSTNTKIVSVLANGTHVNVTLPNSPQYLTTLQLGTPTAVNISNPARLSISGISVLNSSNITSVDIVNMPNLDGYKTFAKIMNLS